MLVCNVSLRPPRAISADIIEAITAADAAATGNVVFATLVDDPANVRDIVDAYLGEIMLEAASASEALDAGLAYISAIDEVVTALDTQSVAAAALTTFDGTPSAAIIMSNGNLTVTHGSTTNGVGVASTVFRSAGKYYWEVTLQVSTATTNGMGIKPSAATFSGWINPGSGTAAISFGTPNTYPYMNGTQQTAMNLGTAAVGDVFGIAVDLDAKLFWARRNNGNWNANVSANPVTGTGGATVPAGALTPFVRFTNGAATDALTANFGQATYANAAPSGFVNWG